MIHNFGHVKYSVVSVVCCSSLSLSGVHHFRWDFRESDRFFIQRLSNHIPSLWMVHDRCVFVAGIHPFRTWTLGSFESMLWNACLHRIDLCLYSHLKEFLGTGVRTHVSSKGKIPSTGKILPRGTSNPWRFIKQNSKRSTLPTSYSGHEQRVKEADEWCLGHLLILKFCKGREVDGTGGTQNVGCNV